jgi:hypothetical protein
MPRDPDPILPIPRVNSRQVAVVIVAVNFVAVESFLFNKAARHL